MEPLNLTTGGPLVEHSEELEAADPQIRRSDKSGCRSTRASEGWLSFPKDWLSFSNESKRWWKV